MGSIFGIELTDGETIILVVRDCGFEPYIFVRLQQELHIQYIA